MSELYQNPKYYEIVFGKRNFKKECVALMQLIKKFSKIQVSNILDIACGTGQHMTEFSKVGLKVAGLDISARMISETKQKFQDNPNLISLYKEDMSSFKIAKKFDACICMVNSLEILTTNNQIESHFKSVADCLNKGGIYIIELDNPAFAFSNPLSKEKPKVYKWTAKKGKIKINVAYKKCSFDLLNSLEKNELTLDVSDNGKIMKLVDTSPIRRLTPQEIDLFIKINKQLKIVKVLGGFDLNSSVNDRNSKKMIIIFQRL